MELDSAFENAGLDPRESKEQICLLIPRWHIETWILHLSGHNVDESQSYKKDARAKAVDFDRIAEEFVAYRDWKQGASDKPTLPAMLAAFEEIRRLNLRLSAMPNSAWLRSKGEIGLSSFFLGEKTADPDS